jgi:uncharacterized protein YuzE
MAKRAAAAKALEQISGAVPHLIRLPAGRAWLDYDREADVLYISLKRPQKATDTEYLEDDGILLRYKGKELVGVTSLRLRTRNSLPHQIGFCAPVAEIRQGADSLAISRVFFQPESVLEGNHR